MTKKKTVSIDFITTDPANDEFVLYLVEEGPWNGEPLEDRLRGIQERIYNAIDVAIDGYLEKAHPESRGSKVRIQIDLHDNPPAVVDDLVRGLTKKIASSREHQRDIDASEHIDALRIIAKRL